MTTPDPVSPYAPPAAPKKGMPAWGWILIAVGACAVLLCVGLTALVFLAGKSANVGDSDVRITLCTPDPSTGWARATVAVLNGDSRQHDYIVNVAFERGGSQVGTGFVVISDLAPGQSAVDDAVALGKDAVGYTCRITDVTRT